jgi:hypothetical protein
MSEIGAADSSSRTPEEAIVPESVNEKGTNGEADSSYLVIATGIESSESGTAKALKALRDIRKYPGYLIDAVEEEPWRFSRVAAIGDRVCLLGPYIAAFSLAEVVQMESENGLSYLLRLVEAIVCHLDRGGPPIPLSTDGVFFTGEKKVLFLPPQAMGIARDLSGEQYRIEGFERVNHPYLDGKERLSFSIAILLYRVLTGEYPYDDPTEEGLRNRFRKFRTLAPVLIRPELKDDISGTLEEAFAHPGAKSLDGWIVLLKSWQKGGIYRKRTVEEGAVDAGAVVQRRRAEASFRRRRFWERHRRLVVVLAVAAVLTGAVLGTILRTVFSPRLTEGFSPKEVVQAFYTGMNSLNHGLMEDAVVGSAGKVEIDQTLRLFILSRQTTAYEGRSYLIPADVWEFQGRPALTAPYTVYGVIGLSLREEEPKPRPVFTAEYEKWSQKADTTEAAVLYEGHLRKDRVSLMEHKGDWVIDSIETIVSQRIPE